MSSLLFFLKTGTSHLDMGGAFRRWCVFLFLFFIYKGVAAQEKEPARWHVGIIGGPIIPFTHTTHKEPTECVRMINIVGVSPGIYIERHYTPRLSVRATFKTTPLRTGFRHCRIQDDSSPYGMIITGRRLIWVTPNHVELSARTHTNYVGRRLRFTGGAGIAWAGVSNYSLARAAGGVGTNFSYAVTFPKKHLSNFLVSSSVGAEFRIFRDSFITLDAIGQLGLRKIFIYDLNYTLREQKSSNQKISRGSNLSFVLGYKFPLLIGSK